MKAIEPYFATTIEIWPDKSETLFQWNRK